MQQVRLEAQRRRASGKGTARGMRRAGHIPAILYGRKDEVIPIRIEERGFRDFLQTMGRTLLSIWKLQITAPKT